ncbi:MAG TPA: ATP synthase F1 subunit delta [Acidobacteriaceae bacterium]
MAGYAIRYARALADVVTQSTGETTLDPSAIDMELASFAAAWQESKALRGAFLDPSVAASKKVAILDKLAPRLGLSKTTRNFLAVLSNHDRMEGVTEVLEEYRREMRARLGVAEVAWTTARPLGDEERQALVQRIGALAGAQVDAKFFEDPSLLGGALLRIGSTVYDGTVRGRVQQLKEKLAVS